MTNPFDTASGEVSGTAVHTSDTANMEESTEHTSRIDLTTDEEGAQCTMESKVNPTAIKK